MDGAWHNWRVTWNPSGMYFWMDYVDGAEPYFSVPATGIEDLNDPIREWPFNEPGYTMFPVLNLAVGGSGGGDPCARVLSGRNARRLGARFLARAISLPQAGCGMRATPGRGFITPFAKVA